MFEKKNYFLAFVMPALQFYQCSFTSICLKLNKKHKVKDVSLLAGGLCVNVLQYGWCRYGQ